MGPLDKNQVYLVESDFFDWANVLIEDKKATLLDLDNWVIYLQGGKEIPFDKCLIATQAMKKKPSKSFANLLTIDDFKSHAWAHNLLLKANSIMIMGWTIEAYQRAASIREYLNSLGDTKTKICILDDRPNEFETHFGP